MKDGIGRISGLPWRLGVCVRHRPELNQRGKISRQDAKTHENAIGKAVVDAAVQVHRELGPGLLETVYEVVLARELERRGLRVERQVPVSINYGGLRFDEGFRADIIVRQGDS